MPDVNFHLRTMAGDLVLQVAVLRAQIDAQQDELAKLREELAKAKPDGDKPAE